MYIKDNPAVYPIKVSWNNSQLNEPAQIHIFNSVGSMIYEKKVNLTEGGVELNDFQTTGGIYFITLKTKTGFQTKKLIML